MIRADFDGIGPAEQECFMKQGRGREWRAIAAAVAVAGWICRGAEDGKGGEAEKLLRTACDFVREMKTLRLEIVSTVRIEAEGMRQEMSSRSLFAVRRPKQAASVLTYGFMGGTVVCDGKTVYRCVPMIGRYTEEAAPETLSELEMEKDIGMLGTGFPLMQALISADPAETMLAAVTKGESLGVRELDGTKCRVVRFLQDKGFSWEAWIEEGERPVLRQLVPDLTGMAQGGGAFGPLPAGLKDVRYEMRLRLDRWEPNAALTDADFKFDPPPGAVKVASLLEDSMPPIGTALVDKPAPDFTLPLRGGGEFALAKQRGRVVALEFWATWCGVCSHAVPELGEIAAEYVERGLIFMPICVDQKPRDVESYFKKTRPFPTALDARREVGEQYGQVALPLLVLVDRTGVVRAVHAGFSPEIERAIRGDLDRLLPKGGAPEKTGTR
jgi:peroxiredoxin